MRKVCHLTSVHPADDVRITHKECASLAGAGWTVHLVAQGLLPRGLEGVVHHPLPSPANRLQRIFFHSWGAYRVASKVDADIYHFHDPELIPAAALLKVRGKKVIYDVHEDVPKDILAKEWIPRIVRPALARFVALVELFAGSYFDGVITATPAIARRFVPTKTICVSNFPRLKEFDAPDLNGQRARAKFAYVGLINRDRGILQMLDAMSVVNDPMATLELAGPVSSPDLLKLFGASSSAAKVRYHGRLGRGDAMRLLSGATAGLVVFGPLPNHLDAQPNKMFEYMAAGIPVITSDFPLWREIVESIGCGLVVDPLDAEDIACAMRWIADNPDEAQAMGRRGRAAIEQRFNWDREASALLDFYGRLAPAKI